MVTDLNFTVDSVGQIVGVRHHDGLLRAISLEGGLSPGVPVRCRTLCRDGTFASRRALQGSWALNEGGTEDLRGPHASLKPTRNCTLNCGP